MIQALLHKYKYKQMARDDVKYRWRAKDGKGKIYKCNKAKYNPKEVQTLSNIQTRGSIWIKQYMHWYRHV